MHKLFVNEQLVFQLLHTTNMPCAAIFVLLRIGERKKEHLFGVYANVITFDNVLRKQQSFSTLFMKREQKKFKATAYIIKGNDKHALGSVCSKSQRRIVN